MRYFTGLILLSLLLMAGCDSPPTDPAPTPPVIAPEVRTLVWDELMPADFDPGAPFKDMDIASLIDDDPRAQELMAQLRALWDAAPVVTALDGLRVRLPGFVIPLDTEGEQVSQFLLVPFYGACIHVPPPPANQTVLVIAPAGGVRIQRAFETVWVTGQLSAQPADTAMAKAGYTLTATEVQPYP